MTHNKPNRIDRFAASPRGRSTIYMAIPLACALLLGPVLQVGQAMQQVDVAPPDVPGPNRDVAPRVEPVHPTVSEPGVSETGVLQPAQSQPGVTEQRRPGDNVPDASKTILRIPLPPVLERIVNRREWVSGPTDVPLGNMAMLHVPVGYRVSGMTTARDWMKLWRGKRSDELAIVLADDQQTFGVVSIETIDDIGNLQPTDVDAESLLGSLQSRIDNSNRSKLRRGIGIGKDVRVAWTIPPVWDATSSTLSYGVRRIQQRESTAEAHVIAIGKHDAIRMRLFACDATVSSTIPSPVPFASAIEFADEFKRTNPMQLPGEVTKADTAAAETPAVITPGTKDATPANSAKLAVNATEVDDATHLEGPTLSSLIDIPTELHQISTTTKPWFFFWIPDFAWAFVPDWIARLGWFEWLLISTALTTGWGYLRMILRKWLIDRANADRLRGEKALAQQRLAANSALGLTTVTPAPVVQCSMPGSATISAIHPNSAAEVGTSPPVSNTSPPDIAPMRAVVMPPPLPGNSTSGK